MEDTLRTVVKAVDDKKGSDIVVLDVSQVASFTDYFIICTGTSTTQMQTVTDEVEKRVRELGMRALHVEGYKVAEWILIDYGSLVLHVFSLKARAFYDLERLWRDGRRLDVEALLQEQSPQTGQRQAK